MAVDVANDMTEETSIEGRFACTIGWMLSTCSFYKSNPAFIDPKP